MEEMTSQLQSMFQNLGGQKQKPRKLKIKDAMKLLIEEEAAKLVNPEELKQDAIDAVEQHGIVFIDEIDKICKRGGNTPARTSPAKAYSATCCRWLKAAPSPPSTAW
jgi:ATP-dependent HslUV protease ATP-binding subunit HslU